MTPSPAQPPSIHGPARSGPAGATDRRADDASPAAGGFAILLAGLQTTPAPAASAPPPRAEVDGPPDAGTPAPIAGIAPVSDQGAAPPAPPAADPGDRPPAVAASLPAAPTPAGPLLAAPPPAGPPSATPTAAAPPDGTAPQPQEAAADPAGGAGPPQAILPEPAAAAGAPPPTSMPEPTLAPELAVAGTPGAGAIDPRRLQTATRPPDQAGSAVIGAPPSAAPPVDASAPGLPPAGTPEAAGPGPAPGPDAEPSPGPAKADEPAVRSAASSAPALRLAAAPAADGPPTSDARIELPADLAAAASIRPGATPSQSIAMPQQPAAPAPVSVGVQLGVQIAAAVPHRIERLFVQLEPPALGRVEVRLEFSRDNRVSALIAADRHDTLDVLQRDSRALERALQDAGLRLNDNGLSFSLRQDQRQQERGAGLASMPLRFDPAAGSAATAQPSDEAPPVYWFGAQRVLDIRI